MLFRLMILALAIALPVAAGDARAAETAGEVLALVGDCAIVAQDHRQALKVKDVVRVGDTVAVAAGAKLKLRMIDGSVLSAAAGTTLTIDAYGLDSAATRRDAGMTLAQGLLHAVVSSMATPSRFEVSTATAVAAVRSTDWFIEASAERTKVGVTGGVVALSTQGAEAAVDIAKGFGAWVKAGEQTAPPRVWTESEFEEYRQRTDLP